MKKLGENNKTPEIIATITNNFFVYFTAPSIFAKIASIYNPPLHNHASSSNIG
jgi:hypothetical protein